MSARSRGGVYLIRCRKPSSFLGLGIAFSASLAALMFVVTLVSGWGWWSLTALLLLLFSGRHNAYAGMTNSFYHRKNQHLLGDVVYGTAAKPWSDLEPRFYKLLALPRWVTHKGAIFRGRWTLETLETAAIWLLIPVYNVKKQAPYNLRRISLRKAQAQRWSRQQSGMKVNIGRAAARWTLALIVFAGAVYTGWEMWL
jgi:hypothetical protein